MYTIIHPIEPFDASIGTEINFTWQGNQIYKVRCIIKNNETGATVYDYTESTMKQSYTVPANSGLTNGTYYIAYITVFDVNNNESDLQGIGTPFYCFSKPTFSLSIPDGGIVQTSTYKVGVNYSQTQNESLDSFSVTLYTYQKTVLSSSGDIYSTSDMSYVISGLENAKQYYLRATGKTLHGITLDTGYVLITVSYLISQIFSTLELNNKPDAGAIEIKSNIISAIGVPEKDVIFIDGEYADLRDNSVTFDEGFDVNGDFTKIFIFYNPTRNKPIITFGNGDKLKVNVYYRIGNYSDSNGEKAYFELIANSCGINYVINSNYVNVQSYQRYGLLVNRQGSYYEMKAVVLPILRYSTSSDGSNMTEERQPNSLYAGVGYMPMGVVEHENLLINTNQNGKIPSIPNPQRDNVARVDTSWVDGYKLKILCNNTLDPYYRPVPAYRDLSQYQNLTFSFRYSVQPGKKARFRTNTDNTTLTGDGYFSKALSPSSLKELYLSIDPVNDDKGTAIVGDYLNVWDLKLEAGTIATPWTPTPSEWLSDPNNYAWEPIS